MSNPMNTNQPKEALNYINEPSSDREADERNKTKNVYSEASEITDEQIKQAKIKVDPKVMRSNQPNDLDQILKIIDTERSRYLVAKKINELYISKADVREELQSIIDDISKATFYTIKEEVKKPLEADVSSFIEAYIKPLVVMGLKDRFTKLGLQGEV